MSSNLNRHIGTCRWRLTRATIEGNPSSAASSVSISTAGSIDSGSSAVSALEANFGTNVPSDATGSVSADQHYAKQKRKSAEGNSTSTQSMETTQEGLPQGPKRARRAPAAVEWIPESLRGFDLTPVTTDTPIPLPPVRPMLGTEISEERDSFDENTSSTPYHPNGWQGRLPGPGILKKGAGDGSGRRTLTFNVYSHALG